MPRKLSQEYVCDFLKQHGYVLLDQYKNTSTKIKVLCPKKHINTPYFRNLKKNLLSDRSGCLTCSGKSKLNIKQIKEEVEKRNFTLLSDKYVNISEKIKLLCPKGHDLNIRFYDFKSGHGCSLCSKTRKLKFEDVFNYIKKEGYLLISKKYVNLRSKLIIKCDKKHTYTATFHCFKNRKGRKGRRCPKCRVFQNEKECREIFENIFNKKFPTKRPNFLKNPETGYNLELDGYNEELKLAFEYDGKQHYKAVDFFGGDVKLKERQKRDKLKDKLCKDYGIILIRIPYFIKNKEEYVKEMINV